MDSPYICPSVHAHHRRRVSKRHTTVLHEYILKHPFGALITNGKGGLDANHIPFELATNEGQTGILRAHIARANPVWQEVENGDEVLVIFRAGDA